MKRSREDDPFEGLRLRGGDESHGFSQEVEEESSADDERPPRRSRGPRPRNRVTPSGFQPGAIVRVKVQNFVTYEEAEFFLGPNLNMVIGPNGTGKSSLVCAICLGLGYGSNVLGRASAFGEFVKHGKDEADIEVELQKQTDDPENYVVGLTIRREDNSRRFTINGRRASLKDIQELMRALRIQIDNLCQFLPQDKVAEFAALTPIELLEKTLHAAAPEEMISLRNQLKDLFRLQKDTDHEGEQIREELRKMGGRQQVLQADVEKLRERKTIQETIEDLTKLRCVVSYEEARKNHSRARLRKAEAKHALEELQRSLAPSLEAVNKKQQYRSKISLVVADRQQRLDKARSAVIDAAETVTAAEIKCQDLVTKKETDQKLLVNKKNEIGRLRKQITDLEAQLRRVPPEFDAASWNRKIREQQHLERENAKKLEELDLELSDLTRKSQEVRQHYHGLAQNLKDLESQDGQLLAQLKKHNSDAFAGWEWLKDNQAGFEKEVFGPPMLTCSVKDARYTDLVQSILQPEDFFCFTAQTKEDHKKLSDQFYKNMGLSVTIRSCFTQYSAFTPPLPKDQLLSLGFDGYVTDFLDGPEPVLAMLCSERRIHVSAVGLRDLDDAQFEQIQQVGSLSSFAAGRQFYRITRRREYGPGAVSTRVTPVQKGRFWTDQPADTTEKAEIEKKIEEIKRQHATSQARRDAIAAERGTLQAERQAIKEKETELLKAKNELQQEFNSWKLLPGKIEKEQKSLEEVKDRLMEGKAQLFELEKSYVEAVLAVASAVLEHNKKLGHIRTAHRALLEAQLVMIEAESEVTALKARNAETNQRLEDARNLVKQLSEETQKLRDIVREASGPAAEVMSGETTDDMKRRAEGMTVGDVDQNIAAEKAKLEVIQAGNPAALEEYERYAARMEREQANLEAQEAKLAELNNLIHEIKTRWEPKLEQLVGQINDAFSYNFEQINCAGEVGVHKDEEFEKWAIEIKVKFRENETLQRLDQHRQSGGERAVSTIFYLMALQSMAQAPFRVVDEINQGMDPRNERMVHERMVEVACREHTSQYFLITPKLLSGLRYDERMRVHTIVSGEYVDRAGTEKMNFGNFVKIRRRLAAGH
ncbi:SMC5-like protein [Dichotomopilus funicola]|uniref:Structural maintenance of chromosomes protein 5 n=1 Tax=Dichotomopilus funicola TaxID=1934379 RepID=A0AAN6V7A0_9PEZI|nr:SMC5-like protein [Dichotomopilus funicola]